MQTQEIKRRRSILQHYVGQPVTVKRDANVRERRLRGLPDILTDVRRSYVTVDYDLPLLPPDFDASAGTEERQLALLLAGVPESVWVGKWELPVEYVLLPGSVEPAVGQRELFP